MALYFLDARPVEAPLPPSAVLREPQLGRAKPPSRQELISSAVVGDLQTVGIGEGHPAQLRVAADAKDTPDLLAAWRLGARKTTPRRPPPLSKSRSPSRGSGQVAPSRQAAKRSPKAPSSATSRPSASARDARPTSASRRSSGAPQTSWRLCGLAREKQRRHDHPPLEEPIAATPEQVAQSRRAAERSPQARSSGTFSPSERDAQLRVTASVGDTPDLSAALRLCARKTPPPPHQPLEEPNHAAHPQRSAPPHPHTPTFFASPSCVLSPHKPNSTCAALRTRRPQAPVSLNAQKHEGALVLRTTRAPDRNDDAHTSRPITRYMCRASPS